MIKKAVIALIMVGLLYGGGRLYYALTGGFTEGNITSDLAYDPRWEIATTSSEEKSVIDQALSQEYTYLGKGCQSYVFSSADGKYVLKFIKFQRFRRQWWLEPFTFIPAIQTYQNEKAIQKKKKLDNIFTSWVIAYNYLRPETGVIYVHLNKGQYSKGRLALRDKIGIMHELPIEQMEFLLQRRAVMLGPYIDQLMAKGNSKEAEALIDRLLQILLYEYSRGFADNDHALMQNTGVLDGMPVHIDVGQFIYNEIVQSPEVYLHEIYDKTYKFHEWLMKHHPQLALFLRARLVDLLGMDYYTMAPYVHKGDVAKIPNQL